MMTMRRLLGTSVLGTAVVVVACGPPRAHVPDETLVLEPFFRDLRVVRVKSSAGPLTLLFDIGDGATAITPEVAR